MPRVDIGRANSINSSQLCVLAQSATTFNTFSEHLDHILNRVHKQTHKIDINKDQMAAFQFDTFSSEPIQYDHPILH